MIREWGRGAAGVAKGEDEGGARDFGPLGSPLLTRADPGAGEREGTGVGGGPASSVAAQGERCSDGRILGVEAAFRESTRWR